MVFKKYCKNVVKIVQKNLKVLLRSKLSSLIVILGPLLIIFLAGLAFDNTNTYSLKIGMFSPDESDMIQSFKNRLDEQFDVILYSNKKDCIADIEEDLINTCMVFSENFTLARPPNNEIKFYVDYSRINLVWTVLNVMTTNVGSKVMELSRNLTSSLLSTIDNIQQEVSDRRSIVVRLTTENDIINRNAANLAADLGDIDLSFDAGSFKTAELQSRLNKVKHWLDTALSLGKEGLQKASTFIDSAGDLAGDNAKDSLQQSIDKIIVIKERLSKTEELSAQEFASFSGTITEIIGQIDSTRTQLDKADNSRKVGVRVLDALRNLLDESLINLMEIQKSFDLIQNLIDDIEIKSTEGITQPIVTSIMPIANKQTYLNYLFPALIILVLMFTALLIVPTLILLEKNSPAVFRNFMTPVPDSCFFLASFFTSFIILLLQAFIVLAITSLFFSTQIASHLFSVLLIIFLGIMLFTLFGMIIGYLFRSEETAIIAGVSSAAIMIFISNLIIPIESMPFLISKIAAINPFVIVSEALRKVLLFDSALPSVMDKILLLLIYIIFAALIALIVFFTTKKRSLKFLIKKFAPVVRYVRRRSI